MLYPMSVIGAACDDHHFFFTFISRHRPIDRHLRPIGGRSSGPACLAVQGIQPGTHAAGGGHAATGNLALLIGAYCVPSAHP